VWNSGAEKTIRNTTMAGRQVLRISMTGHSTFWEANRHFVGGEPIDGGPGSAPSLDDQLLAELRLQDTKALAFDRRW
jgi:hypothetical protein